MENEQNFLRMKMLDDTPSEETDKAQSPYEQRVAEIGKQSKDLDNFYTENSLPFKVGEVIMPTKQDFELADKYLKELDSIEKLHPDRQRYMKGLIHYFHDPIVVSNETIPQDRSNVRDIYDVIDHKLRDRLHAEKITPAEKEKYQAIRHFIMSNRLRGNRWMGPWMKYMIEPETFTERTNDLAQSVMSNLDMKIKPGELTAENNYNHASLEQKIEFNQKIFPPFLASMIADLLEKKKREHQV